MKYILEMENIYKAFPGVVALNNVNLKVRKGTVHALMGENGAGKSTLMKILMGIYHTDKGSIKLNDNPVSIHNPNDAFNKGISMIHQELSCVTHMSVAENIWLGREPMQKNKFLVNHKVMKEKTKKILAQLQININPEIKMGELSVAQMQMIEIAKAISYDADIIVMDEPTSAITEQEVEHLFRIINDLKKKHVSIIYITHKMDEVFAISDDITVLRDGQFIDTKEAKTLDKKKLIKMMVGRELNQIFPKTEAKIGNVLLSVKNFSLEGKFNNINFDLKRGEILGIAGLMGAGRTEVVESIFGVLPKDEGNVFVDGKEVSIKSPQDAVNNNMALLTEDRKLDGLFLPLTVMANGSIASIPEYQKMGFIKIKKMRKLMHEQVKALAIKTPSIFQIVNNLSGGNQQKVLLARWLLTLPEILMLDEPTRGIDVGAKSEIHKLMCKLAKKGKAIIMISSELPEILGMSDRIIVMHEGNLAGILNRDEATQEKILQLASGEKLETAIS